MKVLMHGTLGVVFFFSTLQIATAQCLDGDCQNGRGTMQFDNNNKYAGDFRRGIPQGKGMMLFANGNRYNGDWLAGERDGTGMFTFSTGDVYVGAFRKNRFNGQGTMTRASGNKFVGNWENDQPNGQGKYIFTTGDRYEGAFVNGKFDGLGAMFYKNNEKYVGEWRNNTRSGRGKMFRADGSGVEGIWENNVLKTSNGVPDAQNTEGGQTVGSKQETVGNKVNSTPNNTNSGDFNRDCNANYCRDGKGTFKYGDGSRWLGEFKEGVPEGGGTCFYANGDKYVGKFERHAPNGEGTMFHANGRTVSAIWEYGRPIGDIPTKVNAPATEIDHDPEVKIWAVVVGVGRYSSMPVLKYSDDDAYQFYAFLKSPEGGALPDRQVKVLVDEDATRSNVLQTMRQILLKADENDVIVFYFSGHGVDGAFLPQDFDGINNRLLHSEVKQIFEQSHAKHKICIADACFSGSLLAMKQGFDFNQMKDFYRAFENTAGGMALLMSSKSQEYSLEDQGLRSGIFSHYLIRGLKGEADVDGDHIVTIREIYDYVYKNVRTYTSNAQTPNISGNYDAKMPVAFVRN